MRSVAILLHRRWANASLHFRSVSGRVDVDAKQVRLRLITAHMPHIGYADEDYESALDTMDVLHRSALADKRVIIYGIDANAVFGSQLPQDTNLGVLVHTASVRDLLEDMFSLTG